MSSVLLLTCVLCNESIPLEESKITEEGKPVHEECYYQKVKARKEREQDSP